MKRDHENSGSGADSKHGARSSTKRAGAPSRVRSVLNLQRSAGNRAVSSRLATSGAHIPIQRDYKQLEADLGVTDTSELVEALRDVIGNSKSPTALAGKLRSNLSTNKIGAEAPTHGPNSTDSAGQPGGYTPTTPVTASTLESAKKKALGQKVELTKAEKDTSQQGRYNTLAGLRTTHEKLFGSPFKDEQVEDLSDLTKTSDEAFATITSRYKTVAPLGGKLKKAYGDDLSKADIKVGDGKKTLGQLLDPATSDDDFAQFQADLTTSTKSVTDLEDIKKLEGELERSDMHLHPKSDAALKAMSPEKRATYLKYLKKKADEISADEEDTFAQQQMNQMLIRGGVKTKEERAAEAAAKKK